MTHEVCWMTSWLLHLMQLCKGLLAHPLLLIVCQLSSIIAPTHVESDYRFFFSLSLSWFHGLYMPHSSVYAHPIYNACAQMCRLSPKSGSPCRVHSAWSELLMEPLRAIVIRTCDDLLEWDDENDCVKLGEHFDQRWYWMEMWARI